MSKGFASSYRIVLLSSGLFVCFAALGVRLVWLHVIDREALLQTIVKVRQHTVVEPARRGDIRDANGGILATSHSLIVLGVDPSYLRPQDEPKWPQLAAMIGMPEAELRRIFTTKFREPAPAVPASPGVRLPGTTDLVLKLDLSGIPAASPVSTPTEEPADDTELEPGVDEKSPRKIRWVKLREGVSEELFAAIQKLNIQGVRSDRVYRRAYPNGPLAAHIIGYVNKEQSPATGIEAESDFYLRGRDGWRMQERDGRGRELPQFLTRRVPPSDGYSVWLSIDTFVQDIVEQELLHIAEKFRPAKASIVVSDPRTGFILAMGNYPTFDLNEYNKVPKEEMARMKNVAVTDIYEPGSVFKIVPIAGALEQRLVTPMSRFDCEDDQAVYRGREVRLPKEDHAMGELTVSEILSRSSNRGAARLGMLLGDERLYNYARAFGFGTKLGFPVGGEVKGLLHPYRQWKPVDTTRITMGHFVSSTVLQMHQAMAVIASGGVLLRPQIIREIRDAANEPVYRFDRVEIGRAISPETARTVATMLLGVTQKGGTAPEAAIEGYDVAGKTGTSQKLIDGEYSNKHHVASFVGFFPAGDPQIAISVIVDDADRGAFSAAYGSKVAGPSFKRIGERLIAVLNIKPDRQRNGAPLSVAREGGRR